jgi:hypothetical protein
MELMMVFLTATYWGREREKERAEGMDTLLAVRKVDYLAFH